MKKEIRLKIIDVCDAKIATKGENVGLSFYAFFKNKNDNPKHKLDNFEKAQKIKDLVLVDKIA